MDATQTSAGVAAGPASSSAQPRAWPRRLYLILAWLFLAGVVAQAFLAGAGLFVPGQWLLWHGVLGHLLSSPLPVIPALLLILSFVGRMPAAVRWLTALLLILAWVQPVFLYLRGLVPLLASLHPVNALLLFALPLALIARARAS